MSVHSNQQQLRFVLWATAYGNKTSRQPEPHRASPHVAYQSRVVRALEFRNRTAGVAREKRWGNSVFVGSAGRYLRSGSNPKLQGLRLFFSISAKTSGEFSGAWTVWRREMDSNSECGL